MKYATVNAGDGFLASPTNKVLGVLKTPEQLRAAVIALNQRGFGEDAIEVLCCDQGANRLDVTGEQYGLLAHLYRFIGQFGDTDLKNLGEYRKELLNGNFMVVVDAPVEEQQREAGEVLVSHGGNRVSIYGRWTVEKLAS